MAASLLPSSSPAAATRQLLHTAPTIHCFSRRTPISLVPNNGRKTMSMVGLRMMPSHWQVSKPVKKTSRCFKPPSISSSLTQLETLEIVKSTIAKQLSIDEATITPQTKFGDLGADSLDTVEIMMGLEERFGVSIGETGAESITTVQDAADLIEKVKADSSS